MRRRLLAACALAILMTPFAFGQGDVIGVHDLSPGSPSPTRGPRPGACTYCHVPHSGNGNMVPLWNQKLSTASYTTYTSTTYKQQSNATLPLGSDSGLCLSCHDGTVAAGDTVLYGTLTMQGKMLAQDSFGTTLQNSHPFSLVLPMKDSITLVSTLVQGKTADPSGAVQLVQGNVECTSCHNPHVQATDKVAQDFLVRDGSSGQLCLACHDPTRTSANGTTMANPMAGWAVSIHATSPNKVDPTAGYGSYGTVAANACSACHAEHNAQGAVRLLRGLNEQACAGCHAGGSTVSPAAPNVFAEFAKIGHPFPTPTAAHDDGEPAVLNNNRHATCADCHNAHASQQVTSFGPPPLERVSQAGTNGVAMDGITVLSPATNQYEVCLRCHGYSSGKVANPIYGYAPQRASADPYNVILQMNSSAKSSHPVMHARSSPYSQPSLLPTMLDFNGTTTNGRTMGNQILCTDCHNSDDNREFGLNGPNGPHGSKWLHILERQYVSSQAPGGPGTAVTVNLNPTPDLTVNGPYGMCAKCHNLSDLVAGTSWAGHQNHVWQDGFSCSTCHNPHGITATSANATGERMVDFDLNVVGQNGVNPITYNRATNTCTLSCHNHPH